MLLTYLIN